MCTSLSHQDISRYIDLVANHPEKYSWQVRKNVYLDRMPLWSILYPLEKLTGIPGRVHDFFMTARYFIRYKRFYTVPHNNLHSCGYTNRALLLQNMFNQKYIQDFKYYYEFLNNLQNAEPGLFKVTLTFLDHSIMIIKNIENSSTTYRIVQSYVHQYSLKDFLQNHGKEFQHQNFEELSEKFLQPLKTILDKTGQLEENEIVAFEHLTKIRENRYLGRKIPVEGIHFSTSRTTNVPQDNFYLRKVAGLALLIHVVSTIASGFFGAIIIRRLVLRLTRMNLSLFKT